ncbi:unnamed protein product [Fusarium graminearum]|uniref:Uncharacterized protein n=1 Tax=Gibberella zeae TaxID=5518 RepID=A0A4E9ELY0_GIBZA|nr:unnamed protein product [Fusarium graminearum]
MKARGAIWRQIRKVNRVIDLKQQEEEGGECKDKKRMIGSTIRSWMKNTQTVNFLVWYGQEMIKIASLYTIADGSLHIMMQTPIARLG